MVERVGIVATAQTKYESAKSNTHLTELVMGVVDDIMNCTGLSFGANGDGITGIVTCSQDHCDGRTISNIATQDVVGGHFRDEVKVAGDGAYAVLHGMMEILAGYHDIVLVVSHRMESITEVRYIENWAIDHIYHRMLGLDFLSCAAMQARAYMSKYNITREQCTKVVIKNRGNGKNNPYAQDPLDIVPEDISRSPMLSSPITTLDAKPISDGACAILLANEREARKITGNPVWIKGVGNCYDAHFPGDRDLANCDSLISAGKQAYKMAGIINPRKEIDLVEMSEVFSYQELLWSEGLGLCEQGQGGMLIDSGETQIAGNIPINPSGGLLCGVPDTVAGMSRIAEATLQLQGNCDNRQIEKARVALAHGTAGVCGQMHCVFVLEKGG